MAPSENLKSIVIVGGGTAGWLTAGIIAAEHCANGSESDGLIDIKVTLVESPDISTIGVGEGTWPSMRSTLQKMGISETDLIRDCDASFKQGRYLRVGKPVATMPILIRLLLPTPMPQLILLLNGKSSVMKSPLLKQSHLKMP